LRAAPKSKKQGKDNSEILSPLKYRSTLEYIHALKKLSLLPSTPTLLSNFRFLKREDLRKSAMIALTFYRKKIHIGNNMHSSMYKSILWDRL
jgi:hypothetical protein